MKPGDKVRLTQRGISAWPDFDPFACGIYAGQRPYSIYVTVEWLSYDVRGVIRSTYLMLPDEIELGEP